MQWYKYFRSLQKETNHPLWEKFNQASVEEIGEMTNFRSVMRENFALTETVEVENQLRDQ